MRIAFLVVLFFIEIVTLYSQDTINQINFKIFQNIDNSKIYGKIYILTLEKECKCYKLYLHKEYTTTDFLEGDNLKNIINKPILKLDKKGVLIKVVDDSKVLDLGLNIVDSISKDYYYIFSELNYLDTLVELGKNKNVKKSYRNKINELLSNKSLLKQEVNGINSNYFSGDYPVMGIDVLYRNGEKINLISSHQIPFLIPWKNDKGNDIYNYKISTSLLSLLGNVDYPNEERLKGNKSVFSGNLFEYIIVQLLGVKSYNEIFSSCR